ncbi:intercellular adhesion molecule 5 [Lonchura striata]
MGAPGPATRLLPPLVLALAGVARGTFTVVAWPRVAVVAFGGSVTVNCSRSACPGGDNATLGLETPLPATPGAGGLRWQSFRLHNVSRWSPGPVTCTGRCGDTEANASTGVLVYQLPEPVPGGIPGMTPGVTPARSPELPERVELEPVPPVAVGDSRNVTCRVREVAPLRNLTVTLRRGTETLRTESFGDAEGSASVAVSHPLTVTRGDHGQHVTCHAELSLRPHGPLFARAAVPVTLSVFALPEPPQLRVPAVLEAGTVTAASCRITGAFPAGDVRVTAALDREPLNVTAAVAGDTVTASTELSPRSPGPRELSCTAAVATAARTARRQLHVYRFPVPTLQLSPAPVAAGGEVTVTCRSGATEPPAARLQLRDANGGVLAEGPPPRLQLRLPARRDDDGREFRCRASLAVGDTVLTKDADARLAVLCACRGPARRSRHSPKSLFYSPKSLFYSPKSLLLFPRYSRNPGIPQIPFFILRNPGIPQNPCFIPRIPGIPQIPFFYSPKSRHSPNPSFYSPNSRHSPNPLFLFPEIPAFPKSLFLFSEIPAFPKILFLFPEIPAFPKIPFFNLPEIPASGCPARRTWLRGTLAALSCRATGNPAPTVTCGRRGVPVATTEPEPVTRSRAGTYVCNATNALGTRSRRVTVRVEYEPTLSEAGCPARRVWVEGQRRELECRADGDPAPSTSCARRGGTRGSGTRGSGTRGSGTQHDGTQHGDTRGSGTQHGDTQHGDTRGSGTRGSGTRGSGTQHGDTQHGDTRDGGTRGSGTRGSGTQHGDTQHGDTRGSGTQHGDTQHGDTRGSGTRGSGTQHGDTRGSGTQHGDTQHGGTRGSGTQHGGTQHGDTRDGGARNNGTQHGATQHGGTHNGGIRESGTRGSGTHNGGTHHGDTHDGDTQHGDTHDGGTQKGGTRDGGTHNGEVTLHGDTLDGGTHDGDTLHGGTHDGDNHYGGTHEVGTSDSDTHHGEVTHDGGTHDGGTHDGGTHDGGTRGRVVTRADGGRYVCRATNRHGVAVRSVLVTVEYRPSLGERGCPERRRWLEGTPAELGCAATGNPPPRVTCAKLGEPGNATGPGDPRDPPRATANVTRAHAGTYRCRATNAHGSAVRNVTVAVESAAARPGADGPAGVTVRVLPSANVSRGGGFTVECGAEGLPVPTYSWALPPAPNLRLAADNRSVTVTGATAANRGVYTCTASNRHGRRAGSVVVRVDGSRLAALAALGSLGAVAALALAAAGGVYVKSAAGRTGEYNVRDAEGFGTSTGTATATGTGTEGFGICLAQP